jgi:hypothetical protein
MQKLLILLATMTAAKASAHCPDLSGHFECEFGGETWEVTLEQQASNPDGEIRYFMNGDLFAIPDGAERELPESDELRQGLIRSSCDQGALNNEILALVYDEGQWAGQIDFDLSMRISRNDNLVQRQTGVFQSVDGSEYAFDNLLTCTLFELPSQR